MMNIFNSHTVDNRKVSTSSATLQDFEDKIMEKLQSKAVTQTFFGGLKVDPHKIPIGKSEAKRALEQILKCKIKSPN